MGVSPRSALAEAAGLKTDDGIVVDETLQTSVNDVFAAGDVAGVSGVGYQAMQRALSTGSSGGTPGAAVARLMLGIGGAFREAPFFWSQHYDVAISYVGHAAEMRDYL